MKTGFCLPSMVASVYNLATMPAVNQMLRECRKPGFEESRREKIFFMRKIAFLLTVSLSLIITALRAQVSVIAFPAEPQSGPHNYFGVRVTLQQVYNSDVTVTGTIHAEGSPTESFSLTVPTGELTTETSANFYETDPTATAEATLGTIVVGYAGVAITYEANGCILRFNSLEDINAVLDQLEAEYDEYNDDYESQYPNMSAEELDDMDEQNNFDEYKTYKDFENMFNGFCSKRAEVEAAENTWLANNFSGTDPDDIDLTFDETENTIFNSNYSFKVGNDVYQLTSSGMYKNGLLLDDGGNAFILNRDNNLIYANMLNNRENRYSGPMFGNYFSDSRSWLTDCKSNKRKRSPAIIVGNHTFYQKVAINAIGVRTSIKGKVIHYKNGKKKRYEMAVGVSGPVYNLSCAPIGNKSNTNPNGAGYKKRRKLKTKVFEEGKIWKTYINEVGTSFAASGGYSGTYLLTW